MGNAITHLKFRISSIPPELPESEVCTILGYLFNDSRVLVIYLMILGFSLSLQAKESLLRVINDYIQEKILLADKAISQSCMKVINDGDVILVHAQYVC